MLHGEFPPKSFLKEKYAAYSGFDLSQISWYESLAYWKGAVIAQQLYKRYVDGATKDQRMAFFGESAKALAEVAAEIARDI
jgi:aminoglycoside phosphotransferase (APT) family kinase protein